MATPQTKAPATTTYRVTKGSHTHYRVDPATGEGGFIKARAGAADGGDLIDLTDEQYQKTSPAFKARTEAAPGARRVALPISDVSQSGPGFVTPPVVHDFAAQQRGQFAPQAGKPGSVLDGEITAAQAPAAVEGESTATDEYGLSELTGPQAISLIDGLDSVADVEAVLAAEKSGKDRSTVIKAGEVKLDKLSRLASSVNVKH